MDDRVCESGVRERQGVCQCGWTSIDTYPVNGYILQGTSTSNPCQVAQSKRIHDTITPSGRGRQPPLMHTVIMTMVVSVVDTIGTHFISLLKTSMWMMLMMIRRHGCTKWRSVSSMKGPRLQFLITNTQGCIYRGFQSIHPPMNLFVDRGQSQYSGREGKCS